MRGGRGDGEQKNTIPQASDLAANAFEMKDVTTLELYAWTRIELIDPAYPTKTGCL